MLHFYSFTIYFPDNDVASECAPGFELATPSSCYHLDNDAVTWEEANERCATIGGALVAIETDDEQDFVVKTIKQSKGIHWKLNIAIGDSTYNMP